MDNSDSVLIWLATSLSEAVSSQAAKPWCSYIPLFHWIGLLSGFLSGRFGWLNEKAIHCVREISKLLKWRQFQDESDVQLLFRYRDK